MSFRSSSAQFLRAPSFTSARSRHSENIQPRDDIDDFLSSDLELSFASNVSLNSPPRESLPLTPDSEYPKPMDISPLPPPKLVAKPVTSRPRAFTSAARLFGNDVSNNIPSPRYHEAPASVKSGSIQSSSKRTQRAALPMEWLHGGRDTEQTRNDMIDMLPSPGGDAMDVDSSFRVDDTPYEYIPPQSAAPTVTSFNNLFYETSSPRRSFESPPGPQSKKRRSHSPSVVEHDRSSSSSPPLPSSPAQRKFERIAGGPTGSTFPKPSLEGLGSPPPPNLLKRSRRPALSAMVQPSGAHGLKSAYSVLGSSGSLEYQASALGLPPARRAFSALLPPSAVTEQHSDESSFESGGDMSSPAQAYAQRQAIKTIRRCDGTEDFRPLTGVTALALNESPSRNFLQGGLPGFGDNEAHGKVLPCHRVTEDGLMRIKSHTLDELLDGKYDAHIRDFHVIDCRFDYEYNGGHIPGAVNINTPAQVEALLLGPSLMKPKPSVSGDAVKKTVLVFHCEFSAKRAPTFAKHLRARDRAVNNHVYPKIHYPEVYILEGGYCQYFQTSGARCEPPAYVRMDDPTHAASRREDLDQFRKTKFGRHKSYAYGDMTSKNYVSAQQSKRNTAPSGGPPALFAAASAARSRRGGGAPLSTLSEDANLTGDGDDTDLDIGDSPCPPPTKATLSRGKKPATRVLSRAETYGPTRMPTFGL